MRDFKKVSVIVLVAVLIFSFSKVNAQKGEFVDGAVISLKKAL